MSAETNIEFIERYQRILDGDPTSRVFAPLAEAYRRNGNIQRALQICRQGLSHHPDFAGGWYQLGKIFNQRKEIDKALEAFKKTVNLAPENIQAWRALGEIHLLQKNPRSALDAYKRILLINPHDEEAKGEVQSLEDGPLDEKLYPSHSNFGEDDSDDLSEEDAWQERSAIESNRGSRRSSIMANNEEDSATPSSTSSPYRRSSKIQKSILQILTLVDTLSVRNEFARARQVLQKAIIKYGEMPELRDRLENILAQQEQSFDQEVPEIIHPVAPRKERLHQLKINKLKRFLRKVSSHSAFEAPSANHESD